MEIRRGNIFESETQALINPVNIEGVMGKGLAYQFKIKYPDFYVEGQTWLKNYLDFIKKSNSDKKYQDFQKLYPYLNDLKDVLAYSRPFNHDDAKDSFSKLRFKQTKQMVEKTLRLFHII